VKRAELAKEKRTQICKRVEKEQKKEVDTIINLEGGEIREKKVISRTMEWPKKNRWGETAAKDACGEEKDRSDTEEDKREARSNSKKEIPKSQLRHLERTQKHHDDKA